MTATVHRLPGPGRPSPARERSDQFARERTDPGPVVCPLCGVPHHTACAVLHRHLDWLRLRGLSPVTVYERKRALARMGVALPVPVLDATEEHLMAWRATLAHLAPVTICTYVMHANEFYRHAVAEGLIESNPAEHLPVPRRPRLLPRPVSAADLFAALDAAPPRVRPWIALASHAGLRSCEIAGLRVENVHLTERPPVLIVAAASAKGKRTERCIPLCPWLVAELQAARLPSHGYAFPRHDGLSGPNAPWMISKLSAEAFRAAGVAATLHSARHFFGTMTYRNSHDLLAVADMMGHANVATTSAYALFDKSSAAAAVCALPVPGEDQ